MRNSIPNDRDQWWLRFYLAWFAFLTFFAFVNATSILIEQITGARVLTPLRAMIDETTGAWALIPLIPLVRRFDAVFRLDGDRRGRALTAHLLITLPFSALHISTFISARKVIGWLLGQSYGLAEPLWLGAIYEYRKSLLAYIVLVASLYAFRHYVQLRDLLDMPEARQSATNDSAEAVPAGATTINGQRDLMSEALEPSADAVSIAQPQVGAMDRRPVVRRFIGRRNDREIVVSADEVLYIEAAGNYVVLHTRLGPLKLRDSLNNLESQLGSNDFARAHRSHLVNLNAVKEIQPWFHGDHRLILKDGSELNLSRRYRDRFKLQTATPFVPT